MAKWFKHPDTRVGIVTGKISGISVLDCDDESSERCIEELLPDSFLCPMAKTPRGGTHYYFAYHKDIPQTQSIIPNLDGRNNGGFIMVPPNPGLNGSSYTWKQGLELGVLPLPKPPAKLINYICSKYKGGGLGGDMRGQHLSSDTNGNIKQHKATISNRSFKQGTRDSDLFHVANICTKGGMQPEELQTFLRHIANKVCDPPFPEKEINAKIQSALNRVEGNERVIAEEVREYALATDGNFLTTDVYRFLNLATISNKKAANVALLRLVKEGLIEKYGNKRGCYRLVDSECEVIDILNTEIKPLDVRMPLGINKWVHILPKTLIVIAGSQDAGKSALMLNIAMLNRRKHKVKYFLQKHTPFRPGIVLIPIKVKHIR